jgi:hypothetical protein
MSIETVLSGRNLLSHSCQWYGAVLAVVLVVVLGEVLASVLKLGSARSRMAERLVLGLAVEAVFVEQQAVVVDRIRQAYKQGRALESRDDVQANENGNADGSK